MIENVRHLSFSAFCITVSALRVNNFTTVRCRSTASAQKVRLQIHGHNSVKS